MWGEVREFWLKFQNGGGFLKSKNHYLSFENTYPNGVSNAASLEPVDVLNAILVLLTER